MAGVQTFVLRLQLKLNILLAQSIPTGGIKLQLLSEVNVERHNSKPANTQIGQGDVIIIIE